MSQIFPCMGIWSRKPVARVNVRPTLSLYGFNRRSIVAGLMLSSGCRTLSGKRPRSASMNGNHVGIAAFKSFEHM